MNRLSKLKLLITLSVILLITLTFCTGYHNYTVSLRCYKNGNYEKALHYIVVAINANPKSEYLYLKNRIITDMYLKAKLPIIAYSNLPKYSTYATTTNQHTLYLKHYQNILDTIMAKYRNSVILKFIPNTDENEKQYILKNLQNKNTEPPWKQLFDIMLTAENTTPPSILVEVLVCNYDLKTTKNTIQVPSRYRFNYIKNINPKYFELQQEYSNHLKKQRRLSEKHAKYTQDFRKRNQITEFKAAEHSYIQEEYTKRLEEVANKINNVKQQLINTPMYLYSPNLIDYIYSITSYSLSLHGTFEFRVIDNVHRTIINKFSKNIDESIVLEEFSNVHEDDVTGAVNSKISVHQIEDHSEMLKKKVMSIFVDEIFNHITKIFYYRGEEYESLGMDASAWENYFLFSEINGGAEKEQEKVKRFLKRNPFEFPLSLDIA